MVTTEEVRLAEYASILMAPSHSRNHVPEEPKEDEPAGGYPTVVAWQYNGFPLLGDCPED